MIFNYCRLLDFFKRRKVLSELSVYVAFLILLYLTILPLYALYHAIIPEISGVTISYQTESSKYGVVWCSYGYPVKEIVLLDSIGNPKVWREITIIGENSSYVLENSELFLNYTGVVIMFVEMNPPPDRSVVHVIMDLEVLSGRSDLTIHFGNLNPKYYTLSEGSNNITMMFRYRSVHNNEIVYDPAILQLEFYSGNKECDLTVKRIRVVANSDRELVPVRLNYFDLHGTKLNNGSIYYRDSGVDVLIGHYRIYLGFTKQYENTFTIIYSNRKIDVLYLEKNSTIFNFFLAVNYKVKPNINLTNASIPLLDKGIELNITLPLREIDIDIYYANERGIVSDIVLLHEDSVTFILSEKTLKLGLIEKDFRRCDFLLYLLPGNYEVYIGIPTSFGEIQVFFPMHVNSSRIEVNIHVNAVYIYGIVMGLDLFMLILSTIFLGATIASVVLVKKTMRRQFIFLSKDSLFISILLFLISPFLPSLFITATYPETCEEFFAFIIEAPLIIFLKAENDLIFHANICAFCILYGLLALFFWYIPPLIRLKNELSKSLLGRDPKNLRKIIIMSLVFKVTFMFIIPFVFYISVLLSNQPIPEILFLLPGPGLIAYSLSLLIAFLEIRKRERILSEITLQ